LVAPALLTTALPSFGQQNSIAAQTARLTQFVGNNTQLGWSVALDGDTVITGGPFLADGHATVFALFDFGTPSDPSDDVWFHQATLTGSQATGGDEFGHAIDLEGNRAVVGAPRNSPNSTSLAGGAYVFERDGGGAWSEKAYLTANVGASSTDLFGSAVAISGDRILIGARADDANGGGSGSVYAFGFDGTAWVETQYIQAPVLTVDFGEAVAVDGDWMVVGAPDSFAAFNDQGLAFVYEVDDMGTPTPIDDAWNHRATLTPSVPAKSDFFGISVDVSGTTVVVGSLQDDTAGLDSGAAFVFEPLFPGGPWQQKARLTASNAVVNEDFGRSVGIEGNTIAVGAPFDGLIGFAGGAGYVFRRSGSAWSEEDVVYAYDAGGDDRFGFSLSLESGRLAFGAPRYDATGTNQGAGFLFEFSSGDYGLFGFGDGVDASCPCTDSIAGTQRGCVNSAGYGAQLAPIGSDSISAASLNFSASGMPSQVATLLFVSTGQFSSPPPMGDGLLVAGPQLGRLHLVQTNADGFARWGQPLDPIGGPQFWTAGDTRFLQAWYRDTQSTCGAGFNTTNGVRVTFQP